MSRTVLSPIGAIASIVVMLAVFAAHPEAQSTKPRGQAAVAGGASGPSAKPASPVNLNTATAAELEALPGIGAKTAARIVDYRQKKGPFKKIEEILESSRSCR